MASRASMLGMTLVATAIPVQSANASTGSSLPHTASVSISSSDKSCQSSKQESEVSLESEPGLDVKKLSIAPPARVSYEPSRDSPREDAPKYSSRGYKGSELSRISTSPRQAAVKNGVSRFPLEDATTAAKNHTFQHLLGSPPHSSGEQKGISQSQPVAYLNDHGESDEMREIKEENERTKGQLRVLHQKLRHIETGLRSIDEERSKLEGRCCELETEKQEIQKQLNLREKEIAALTRRCASQEEKMKEATKLRSHNRELKEALGNARDVMDSQKQEQEDLAALRKQLQESELAREDLQRRLSGIAREHDAIADTLKECLSNVKLLTEEKQQCEDERRRERKRAELDLEKERLAHLKVSNDLRDDLEEQQRKIQQMERILQENMATNTSLRRERATIEKSQEEKIQKIVDQYEKQVADLKYESEQSLKSLEKECEQRIENIHKEMDEKDVIVLELEMEFSDQMEELMSKSTELERLQEENKSLSDKVIQLKKLENDHLAMLEVIQLVDDNLADVTSENANLILEKDALLEETGELQNRISDLELHIKKILESRRARENDFHDLLQVELGELRSDFEGKLSNAEMKSVALQSELESQTKAYVQLKEELDVARTRVLDTEGKIEDLNCQNHDDIESYRKQVEEWNVKYSKLQHDLEETRACLKQREIRIEEIHDIIGKKEELALHFEKEATTSKSMVRELEESIKSTRLQCSGLEKELEIARKATEEGRNRLMLVEKGRDADLSEWAEKYSKIENELANCRLSVEQREEAIKLLSSEARTTTEALEKKLDAQALRSSTLEEELRVEREMVAETECRIQIMEDEFSEKENLCSKLEATLKEVNSKAKRLEIELKDARDCIVKNHQSKELLEKKVTNFEESTPQLYRDLEESNAEVSRLKNEIEGWKEKEVKWEQDLERRRLQLGAQEDKLIAMDEQSKSKEKNRLELETALCQSKSSMNSMEGELETLRDDYRSIQQELENTLESLSQRDHCIENLRAKNMRIERERNELESASQVSNEAIKIIENKLASRDDKIKFLENQLLDLRNALHEAETGGSKKSQLLEEKQKELTDKIDEMDILLQSKDNQLSSLEKELDATRHAVVDHELTIKKTLSESEEARGALEASLAEANSKVAAFEKLLKSRENYILSIDQQLEDARLSLSEKESLINLAHEKLEETQSSCDASASQIQKMKTELALKDDEIRELRLFELKDAEDAINQLNEEVSQLRRSNDSKEAITSSLTRKFESQVVEWKIRAENLERDRLHIELQHGNKVKELEYRISQLDLERSRWEAQFSEQDTKMEERHAAIVSLTREKGMLEQSERALKEERDKLQKAELEARSEIDKLTLALDKAITRNYEDSVIARETREVAHQNAIEDMRAKLSATEAKLGDMETCLQQRSNLLADMVEHNKSLESISETQRKRLAELESSFSKCQSELTIKGELIDKLRREMSLKEGNLTQSLDEEGNRREIAESELMQVKARLDAVSKEQKDIAELEKENRELKDKVRRQEEFLRRKIHREKILRERNSATVAKATLTTPTNEKIKSLTAKSTGKINPFGENESGSFDLSSRVAFTPLVKQKKSDSKN